MRQDGGGVPGAAGGGRVGVPGALMLPTEILAAQTHAKLGALLARDA